jgi:hypothetical protein
MMWPRSESELVELQIYLAARQPPPWRVPSGRPMMAGCFVCFARGFRGRGEAGDLASASAALMRDNRGLVAAALARAKAGWPYEPGLLALREGPLLETAVRCSKAARWHAGCARAWAHARSSCIPLANRPRHGGHGRLAGDPEGTHAGAPSPGPQGSARGPGGAIASACRRWEVGDWRAPGSAYTDRGA